MTDIYCSKFVYIFAPILQARYTTKEEVNKVLKIYIHTKLLNQVVGKNTGSACKFFQLCTLIFLIYTMLKLKTNG